MSMMSGPGGGSVPRFQGVRTLGKGAHGFVQLAIDNKHDGQLVAIKYIPRGETASFYKYVLREVLHHQQLSLCKHPHIVEFHEVFLTPRYLGVVMEYIDGRDLQAYLVKAGGTLPEDVARFVFQQLVVAVDFIHKKGKVNRDIKLANVLVVDSGSLPLVKMCDFGFSKDKFDDSAPQTQIGTALFTAPEVFLNVQGHVYEGEAVDVWSCGVVLHMLLFGRHPFLSASDMTLNPAEQMVRLIENTVKGQLHVPEVAEGSSAADLLRRILVPSPKQRYGIKDILIHPWFQAKLPPGALELNSAYMPAANYQNARQTPDAIKQIIRSAIQIVGPDGKPTGGPVPSTNSFDMPDSPSHASSGHEEIQQQLHSQQQQMHAHALQAHVPGASVGGGMMPPPPPGPQVVQAYTSAMPSASVAHSHLTSQSSLQQQQQQQQQQDMQLGSLQPSFGMPPQISAQAQLPPHPPGHHLQVQQQQHLHHQQQQQQQRSGRANSCTGESGALQQQQQQQQWHVAGTPTVANAATPTSGYDHGGDPELMDMLQMLGDTSPQPAGQPGASGAGQAPAGTQQGAQMDPDPEVEALLGMDMDVSGNVLFDSSLLKMIHFD